MAKDKKAPKPSELPALTSIQHQVMAYIFNSVAFKNYDDCCSIEDMAAQLERTPRGLMATWRTLEDKGYVTIRGTAIEWVYPTVEALRHQDPILSEEEAKRIFNRLLQTHK